MKEKEKKGLFNIYQINAFNQNVNNSQNKRNTFTPKRIVVIQCFETQEMKERKRNQRIQHFEFEKHN